MKTESSRLSNNEKICMQVERESAKALALNPGFHISYYIDYMNDAINIIVELRGLERRLILPAEWKYISNKFTYRDVLYVMDRVLNET